METILLNVLIEVIVNSKRNYQPQIMNSRDLDRDYQVLREWFQLINLLDHLMKECQSPNH